MKLKGHRGEVYFHILYAHDRRLGFKDGRKVVPGKEIKASVRAYNKMFNRIHGEGLVPKPVAPMECAFGLHASDTMKDAIHHLGKPRVGSWLCLVQLNTKMVNGHKKRVALRRKVLYMRQLLDLTKKVRHWEKGADGNWVYTIRYPDPSLAPKSLRSRDVVKWIMAKPWKEGDDEWEEGDDEFTIA